MEADHALHVPMTELVVSETYPHLDAVDVARKASSPFKSATVPEPDGFFAVIELYGAFSTFNIFGAVVELEDVLGALDTSTYDTNVGTSTSELPEGDFWYQDLGEGRAVCTRSEMIHLLVLPDPRFALNVVDANDTTSCKRETGVSSSVGSKARVEDEVISVFVRLILIHQLPLPAF